VIYSEARGRPQGLPIRYVFTLLSFLGFVFNFTLRININLVITSMVNHTALNDTTHHKLGSERPDGPFVWNSIVCNDVTGLLMAGYMVLQLPGGRLAELWGGKRVMLGAMGGLALLSLLIPSAAKLGGHTGYPYYLVIVRVLMGLFSAATFPCMTSMLARWAPQSERSAISTIVMSGSQVGTIVGFFLSGLLVDCWGWESVFYIQGGACLVWVLLWQLLASDSPASHPLISQAEQDYIQSQLPATSPQSLAVPWTKIWRSLPFWAILLANFGNNWGFHLLLTELPLYLSQVFPDYMSSGSRTGLWTAAPYATMWLTSILVSFLSDFLIRNNILSTTTVRKGSNTFSVLGPVTCLLMIVVFVNNSRLMMGFTLAMFTVGVGCMGAGYSGWPVNIQDIAPNFAGTIFGLTNCIGAIPGFVGPRIAGQLVNSDPSDVNKWRIVWIIAIFILTIDTVVYVIFSSGQTQPWNFPCKANEENSKEGKKDWFLIIFTLTVAIGGLSYVSVIVAMNT